MKHAIRALPLALLLLSADCPPILPDGDWEPTGSAFSLDPGLALLELTPSTSGFSPHGTYTMDLRVRNSSTGRITQTLVTRLCLRAPDPSLQHLVLARDHRLSVPPAAETLVHLGAFSCNRARANGAPGDTYGLGPITDDSELNRVLAITSRKRLEGDLTFVQGVIWTATDGLTVPQSTLDSLETLPDDTLARAWLAN
jgi:hypothetical protein